MNNTEAIEIIKTAIAKVEWDYPMEYAAALDKAVEALKEQEPVKPKHPGTAYSTVWSCGACSYPMSEVWVACPNCGRKVKWDALGESSER